MIIDRGDIFIIDIAENKFCIGQVLQSTKYDIYIVVFEGVFGKTISVEAIQSLMTYKPGILCRTGYTFFELKRWRKITNEKPKDDSRYYPNYKIETLEGVIVTTFDGQPIRKASKKEEEFYQFQNYKSPAYVVSAVKAYHGLIPMDDDYYKLTFEFVSKRGNFLN